MLRKCRIERAIHVPRVGFRARSLSGRAPCNFSEVGLVHASRWRCGCRPRGPMILFVVLVPGGRIELPRCHHHRILSPARLPVPPSRLLGALVYEFLLSGQENYSRCTAAAVAPSAVTDAEQGQWRTELLPCVAMQRSDFFYELPPELIAQQPAAERRASRLLCLDADGLRDRAFRDLPPLLRQGDLLVFNDTRVIPARLYGEKASGGKVEGLVARLLEERRLLAHILASKAPKAGGRLRLAAAIDAEVLGRDGDLFELRVLGDEPVAALLERHGRMPLPPYITRADAAADRERYQTVYARAGRGGGAYRRFAFRRGYAGRTPRAGYRARFRHAARGRGHVSAAAGRCPPRTPHACGEAVGFGSDLRAGRGGARARQQSHRCGLD